MLTDTHAHLFWDSYKNDLDQVIQNCADSGVTTIVNVGTDLLKSQQALDLESGNDKVKFYSTIGIHPHDATEYFSNPKPLIQKAILDLEKIYFQNPQKVIAVGECGLDYTFESHPEWVPNHLTTIQIQHLQELLFTSQIELARKLNLPLVVHIRDDRSKNPLNTKAWDKALSLLQNTPSILHCYSGLLETTKKVLNTSHLVSFAGTLTYPKSDHLIAAVKLLPLEKILLETDCPFLPPQSKRGQRNDPTGVIEIAKMIAQIKNLTLEQVADQTTKNAKSLLKI